MLAKPSCGAEKGISKGTKDKSGRKKRRLRTKPAVLAPRTQAEGPSEQQSFKYNCITGSTASPNPNLSQALLVWLRATFATANTFALEACDAITFRFLPVSGS